jgi:integrase
MDGGIYIHPKNPVQQKFAGKDEIRDETKSWSEFNEDDLKKLFGGQYLVNLGAKPDWYWLPLMSLLSGARLGEIAKLAVDEFIEIEGIHCYKIVRDSAKNKASIRTIPVHSKLIELGILNYVQALRDRGEKRFVARDTLEKNKSKSTGKMWGQHVSGVGIKDDTKVFHSFRSTVITDMHNADAGHATIQRTTGHTTEGTSGAHGGYVRGVKLKNLKATVEKLEYPVIDFECLKLEDPTFKKYFETVATQKTTPKAISHKLHAQAKAARLARNEAANAKKRNKQ